MAPHLLYGGPMSDPHELRFLSASTFSVIAGKLLPADYPDEDVEELCSGRYEIVSAGPYLRHTPAPASPRPTVIPLPRGRTRPPQE